MAHVRDISTEEFPQAVLQRSREVPVVVDFWAAWCGPCKVLGPVLEKLADEADGEFELVKIDVDANQQLAAQFGVQGIPMVMAFRDGSPVDAFTGALPEPQVKAWLERVLPNEHDRAVDAARDAVLEGRPGDVVFRPRHGSAPCCRRSRIIRTPERAWRACCWRAARSRKPSSCSAS